MCSVKPASHVAPGGSALGPAGLGATRLRARPLPGGGGGWPGQALPGGRGGARVSGGRSGRPAPGECPGARRHLKRRAGRGPELRDWRGAAGGAPSARSGAGFEAGPGAGAMASSRPAGPPLLLLVLLAGAARAGLHFRPGPGCYRAPRADRLASMGRRCAGAGG